MDKVKYLKDKLNKAKIDFKEIKTPEGMIIDFEYSYKKIRWTHGSIQAMSKKDIDSVIKIVIDTK